MVGTAEDQGVHLVLTDTTILMFEISDKLSRGGALSRDGVERAPGTSRSRSTLMNGLSLFVLVTISGAQWVNHKNLGRVRLCVNGLWRRLNPHSLREFKVRIDELQVNSRVATGLMGYAVRDNGTLN